MNRAGIWVLVAAVSMVFLAAPVEASVERGPIQKLGRGVANLTTGWTELFMQVFKTTERSGSLAGTTIGFGRGVVLGLGRTVVGALELATFPIPNPMVGYGPVIEPEFVTFRDADRW